MHPIFNFISYECLILSRQFALYVSSVSIPKSYQEALIYPKWKQTIDEMDAIISHQTWDLVPTSPGLLLLVVVGCLPSSIIQMP